MIGALSEGKSIDLKYVIIISFTTEPDGRGEPTQEALFASTEGRQVPKREAEGNQPIEENGALALRGRQDPPSSRQEMLLLPTLRTRSCE